MKKLSPVFAALFLCGCPAPVHKVSIEADSQSLITPVVSDDSEVVIKKYCDDDNLVYWANTAGHSPSLFVLPNSCRVGQ